MNSTIKKKKRKVDILVISDVHLGTYGCQAKELLNYLKSVKPKMIVLNGDIIDIWQFNKRYWPQSHMRVINKLIKWMSKGVPVYYITGNHDEMLRRFAGFKMGRLRIENKLLLELNGEKHWFFHGDVFDVTMKHSKWLAKLGAYGYDLLILINTFCNWTLTQLGREKISLSKTIKNNVKKAVKFISDFEKTAIDIAISNQYQFVLCGHIHHPEIKYVETEKGAVTYLNSGDWIENLSALEYYNNQWHLYKYNPEEFKDSVSDSEDKLITMNDDDLFKQLLQEFKITTSNHK